MPSPIRDKGEDMSDPTELRFLCDAMLAGLGRRLRMAGYDAQIEAGGRSDHELITHAASEGRVLLTGDRQILERKAAREPGRMLYLPGNDELEWARLLRRELGLSWTHRPFTRCLECNLPLRALTPIRETELPAGASPATAKECAGCSRIYWEGSHVERMRAALERLQSA